VSVWEIPPAKCVVFFPQGHIGKVVQTYEKIREWFKTSEYEPRDEGYILEVYNTRQDLNENYVVEMWKEVK
jgi:predicted transcriptional regulator YdeE